VQDVTTLRIMRLAGRAELLKLYRVSPTRLVQITTDPALGHPEPLDHLIGGKIWDLDACIAWARQAGRPIHLEDLDRTESGA
jgi:hypothetical protein